MRGTLPTLPHTCSIKIYVVILAYRGILFTCRMLRHAMRHRAASNAINQTLIKF